MMLSKPPDNQCPICSLLFCCVKCMEKHRDNEHKLELASLAEKQLLQSQCYICNGLPFPFKSPELISKEMMQHLCDHLPLQCDKCDKIFTKVSDFQLIGKCCEIKEEERQKAIIEKENMGDDLKKMIDGEEALTPLSKMNLRWRRKSREFGLSADNLENNLGKPIIRQTSTPVFGADDKMTLSIQYSTINSSSEQDISPAVEPKPIFTAPPKTSPKIKMKGNASKSRLKGHVPYTPLRQVMTKSIQRAMATHGHYKNLNIQQRKMTFESNSSGSDGTVSLLKFAEENDSVAPLDLRTSPAIRRESDKEKEIENNHPVEIKYEEVRVTMRRTEIKSESSLFTNYKSCYSDVLTPCKSNNNNMLAKAISFECPGTVEKTPGYLLTKTKSLNESDEVFYTPRSTPAKDLDETQDETTENCNEEGEERNNLKPGGVWGLVSSVVNYAKKKPENSTTDANGNDKKWCFNLRKSKIVSRAAGYFSKNLNFSSALSDDSSLKRRRTSSNANERVEVESTADPGKVVSPINKRRKIQPRKPIERMRKIS